MIDSRYEWKKGPQTDQDQTKKLAEALNLSELVAEILINRGYDTKEKAENFLKPGPENLYDPVIIREIEAESGEFQEAMIIGRVLGKYQLGIGDSWVALRIEEMIRAGKLETVTEAAENMPLYHRVLKRKSGQ